MENNENISLRRRKAIAIITAAAAMAVGLYINRDEPQGNSPLDVTTTIPEEITNTTNGAGMEISLQTLQIKI